MARAVVVSVKGFTNQANGPRPIIARMSFQRAFEKTGQAVLDVLHLRFSLRF